MSELINIQQFLSTIFEAKGRTEGVDPKTGRFLVSRKDMALTAQELSRLVGKQPPWSPRALQSVYAGTNEPGKKMLAAILAMGAAMDGVSPALANKVEMRLYANPANVRAGAVVLGESRACLRPGCGVSFVPNVPWRKFCSEECRAQFARDAALNGTGD
ncbi:MAG: hypothetical protein EPO32_08475 [Anaerolineae bacterium]|nr:MAG: hypothetical protein EPO32_08475 [Anaerolineae bacterium]